MTKRKQIPKVMVIDRKEYRKLRSFRKRKSYEEVKEKYKRFGFSVRLFQREGKGRRYMFLRKKAKVYVFEEKGGNKR